MTIHTDFLRHQGRSTDTVVAAVADNCRFDERASASRWERFEAMLPGPTTGPDAIDWPDWTETNRLHLDRYCNVPSTDVPDAFHDVNRDAWLDGLAEEQFVVRIEDLTRALRFSALSLPDLRDLLRRAEEGKSGRAMPSISSSRHGIGAGMRVRLSPPSMTKCRKKRMTTIGPMPCATAWGSGTTGRVGTLPSRSR